MLLPWIAAIAYIQKFKDKFFTFFCKILLCFVNFYNIINNEQYL